MHRPHRFETFKTELFWSKLTNPTTQTYMDLRYIYMDLSPVGTSLSSQWHFSPYTGPGMIDIGPGVRTYVQASNGYHGRTYVQA